MLTAVVAFIWSAIVVLVGLIGFATRTGPEDAIKNISRWLEHCGMSEPQKRLSEHWKNRKLRIAMWAAAAMLLAAGIFTAGMLAQAKLAREPHNVPARSANHWPALSEEETVALRDALRKYPPEQFSVLCAIPACADLADGVFQVTHSMGWPGNYESWYLTDHGVQEGIEIWSWPKKADVRDQIAAAIEKATNGRVKVSSHTWETQPSPQDEPMINLVVGRFRQY